MTQNSSNNSSTPCSSENTPTPTVPRLYWIIHDFLRDRFGDVIVQNWANSMPDSYEYIINNVNVGLITKDGEWFERTEHWVDDGKSVPSYYPNWTSIAHISNPNFFELLHKSIKARI